MKHPLQTLLATLAFVSLWSSPQAAHAQVSMSDYTAQPQFVSEVVTPNILFLLDASSSMSTFAANAISGGNWTETQQYGGLFDPLVCYIYDATNKRFDPSVTKDNGLVERRCDQTAGGGNHLWDGNFLNWATTKRFDAAKLAMHGGSCINTATNVTGNRDADGVCLPSGSPAKKTFVNQQVWTSDYGGTGGHKTTDQVATGDGVNQLNGRVPATVQTGVGTEMRFHFRGGVSGMGGSFCTDNDAVPPIETGTTCHGSQWIDANSDNIVDPGEVADDTDSYNEQQFFIRVSYVDDPEGVIQQVGARARMGLMIFETSAKGRLVTPIGSRQNRDWLGTGVETFNHNQAAMIDAVDEAYHIAGTPLVEALYEGLRYMAQIGEAGSTAFHTQAFSPAGALGSSGGGSLGPGEIDVLTGTETCPSGYIAGACGRDPYFFGSDHSPAWMSSSQRVDCCQNYIILFTDGSPNSQSFLPTPLVDYAQSVRGPNCCGIDLDDYDLAGLAYWGHIHDLRQGTVPVINETGHDIPGKQNVTVYSFNAFGGSSGRELLKLTAKLGAFKDKNGNNQFDPLIDEYDTVNNATGAFGADGIPDTYFESDNVDEIKAQLSYAVNNILKQSGSGSSASVLASSSTGEGAIYQSFFFPSIFEGSKEVRWAGFTQGFFIDAFGNLREDSNADGALVYQEDQIIRMRFDSGINEVVLDRYDDGNADGKPDTAMPSGNASLKDASSIWEAGERLALKTSGSRKVLTWLDTDYDGDVDTGEQIVFSTSKLTELTPYLQAGAAPFTAANLINFIRGDHVTGLRDRRLTVGGSLNVWKFGDAIHAPPVVVGAPTQRFDVIYGDSSYTAFFAQYKNRRQVAYVGANDGMLHAFNAGYYHRGDNPATATKVEHGWFTRTPTDNSGGPQLGDELWGFIPQELLPHLRWLADPNYTHVYYVDLKPKVTDARIFTPDADHPNGWGTILMGGFRLGGSCGNCTSGTGATATTINADFNNDGDTTDLDDTRDFFSAYFVLDITNPEKDPVLLHSFSSADLGLTTTVPSMLRVSPKADGIIDNTNAKWFMVMGSGPTGYDVGSTQAGNLYALDLASTGTSVTKLVGETANSLMGTPLSIDRDLDYRVEVVYMGSILDDGFAPWEGKLHRLTMHECVVVPCSTNSWGVPASGIRGASEIVAAIGVNPFGPTVASPAVALDDSNQLWVFAGTGRYFSQSDKTNIDQQYFIGVKDSVLNAQCSETDQTDCRDEDLVDVTGVVVCVLGVGTCGSSTNQVTGGPSGVNDFPSLINAVAAKDGWYMTLSSGERSLARPLVFAGIVFFPTFTPTSDVCSATGNSSLYALYYRTGSAYSTPIIGTTTSGSNKHINKKIDQGPGLTTETGVHIGMGSENGQAQVCSQNSQGEVGCSEVRTAAAFVSRFLTWHEPRD